MSETDSITASQLHAIAQTVRDAKRPHMLQWVQQILALLAEEAQKGYFKRIVHIPEEFFRDEAYALLQQELTEKGFSVGTYERRQQCLVSWEAAKE